MKKALEKLNLNIKDVLSNDELKNIKGGGEQLLPEFGCDYKGFNNCVNLNGSSAHSIAMCAYFTNC